MAIVEAASCGLQVVSTRVGGIPEVLPPDLIHLTDATVESLHKGILTAIQKLQNERENVCEKHPINGTRSNHHEEENNMKKTAENGTTKKKVLCPYQCNEILRDLYNWNDITERTECVYKRVLKEKDPSFGDKLNCYLNACIPFVLVVSCSYLFLKLLDLIEPRKSIDLAVEPQFSIHRQRKQKKNV